MQYKTPGFPAGCLMKLPPADVSSGLNQFLRHDPNEDSPHLTHSDCIDKTNGNILQNKSAHRDYP